MKTVRGLKCQCYKQWCFWKSYKYNNKTPIFLPQTFYLRSFKYFKILDTQNLEDQFHFVSRLKTCNIQCVAKHCVTLKGDFHCLSSLQVYRIHKFQENTAKGLDFQESVNSITAEFQIWKNTISQLYNQHPRLSDIYLRTKK